ncbi:MAG TPA: 1-phosphofructokinase family hexose kinase [Ramlibacter sp.]|nr:1-phosphofructokinase family hexose kinase [Ramlibacter sp.]
MTGVLTLTPNPALDLSTSTEKVMDAHKLRCEAPRFHPGGGGINVARVLHRLGERCLAVYPAGGATGERLSQLLEAEQVPAHCVAIAGETRESFSVRETATGREYRFVLPGPTLAPAEWQACLDFVQDLAMPPRHIVASGSLPPGVPVDFYARLAQVAHAQGSLLVLDASGPPLAAALEEGVYLVKPSLRELRELTGEPLEHEAQWLAAARGLVQHGQARLAALSLGERGALLVSATMALRAPAIAVPVASTIGAGDSFTAGLVLALSRGQDLQEALRTAMAASAAALLVPGTALCQPADVERLRAQVRIDRV